MDIRTAVEFNRRYESFVQHVSFLPMRRLLRLQLERRAPAIFQGIRTIRNRLYFWRRFSRLHEEIRGRLFAHHRSIAVLSGPFLGMRYLDETVWGSITPKWLGSYEAELHGIIDCIAAISPATVLDVGCAEGYYAVGMALRVPTAKIIAFDTDFLSCAQVRRLADLNGVADRIEIRSLCDHAALDSLSVGPTLVICDIEGAEVDLLNPALARSLLHSNILVEVHEVSTSSSSVELLLASRFAASHCIQRIVATDRESWIHENRRRIAPSIPPGAIRSATEESRATGRVWLWMQSQTASS